MHRTLEMKCWWRSTRAITLRSFLTSLWWSLPCSPWHHGMASLDKGTIIYCQQEGCSFNSNTNSQDHWNLTHAVKRASQKFNKPLLLYIFFPFKHSIAPYLEIYYYNTLYNSSTHKNYESGRETHGKKGANRTKGLPIELLKLMFAEFFLMPDKTSVASWKKHLRINSKLWMNSQ